MSTNSPNLKSILARALEIESPAEREAYLNDTCAGNTSLRTDVEGLLAAAAKAGSFMNHPPVPELDPKKLAPTIIGPSIQEGPGTLIGPYKLLQQIGEGGFGVVYMAAQEKPVRRNVALKIIKPGMDSREVIARFEAERQALAMMDHQNIARVLDAGTTDTGRPYFVMELVKGIPITNYCDNNKLTPRERLELFVPVCNAIQHAHQKGIIHRDIKPSNVLVCLYDGKPVPKVIDFGVAKAIEQRLTEKTMFTQHGQVIGTLEYMSPEQAEMSQLDIDTRSDIYSLGVLLYELLTGSTPITKEQLRKSGFVEMLRMIRETEPEKPSVRLSHLHGTLASISAQRRTEPAKLGALIRGDLDWLVMKALEKDRTRRYETANSLARDIERYLHDEPVEACPPSIGYRLRKFTRRNRPAVITGTIVAALALTLLANFFVAHFRLEQARGRAEEAEQLAVNRLDDAERERERAEQADKASQAERDKAITERRRADEQAREAVLQKSRADEKATEALAALDQSEQRLYFNQINSAHQYWLASDVGQVQRIIDAAPPRFRNWEWHYLNRLSHSELRMLPGHGQFVNEVQFSRDGKRLMTFTPFGDSGCKIWEADTGKEIVSISHGMTTTRSPFSGGCLSADGKSIALGDRTGAVTLWETDTGKELRTIGKFPVPPNSLNFSPDGHLLVAAWRDLKTASPLASLLNFEQRELLKVWDVASGAEVFAPRGCGVRAAFSPDGKLLLAYSRIIKVGLLPGTPEYELKIWDTENWKERKTLPEAVWHSFSFSPDSRRVALAGVSNKTWTYLARVVEIESGKEVALRDIAVSISDIAFSTDGAHVALASSHLSPYPITIFDSRTGEPSRKIRGHTHRVTSIDYSPAGGALVSASEDHTVRFWNPDVDQELESLPGQAVLFSTSVAFSPNRNQIAWGSGIARFINDVPIHVWTIDQSQNVCTVQGHKIGMEQVVFSKDGKFLGSAGRDKLAKVWDASSGVEVCTFRGHEGAVQCVALSPDGRWAASSDEDPAVAASRFPPYKQLDKYPPGVVIVWDAQTGQEIRRLQGHARGVYRVAISPDGTRIASTNYSEGKIWDASNGKELLNLAEKSGSRCLLFSPDGRLLVTADEERTIHLWDTETGKRMSSLRGHTSPIVPAGVVFNADGTRLASAAGDFKIWDVATGQELLSLKAPQGVAPHHVIGIAFTPDNTRLLAALSNGTVNCWDATPLVETEK